MTTHSIEKREFDVSAFADELRGYCFDYAALEEHQIRTLRLQEVFSGQLEAGRIRKFYVYWGKSRFPVAFLKMEDPGSSDLVARSIERANQVRSRLPNHAEALSPILMPLIAGELSGWSFAMWPYRMPMHAHKILRFYQRYIVVPRVFRWLSLVVGHTRSALGSIDSHKTIKALEQMRAHGFCLTPLAQRNLDQTLSKFGSGEIELFCTFSHGDLWVGNVLNGGGQWNWGGFSVIDWAGASLEGFPFFDLLRLMDSARISPGQQRAVLNSHAESLGVSRAEVPYFLMSSLAQLSTRLENFPVGRFERLANRLCYYLNAVPG